jgi:hypothetical protein
MALVGVVGVELVNKEKERPFVARELLDEFDRLLRDAGRRIVCATVRRTSVVGLVTWLKPIFGARTLLLTTLAVA